MLPALPPVELVAQLRTMLREWGSSVAMPVERDAAVQPPKGS